MGLRTQLGSRGAADVPRCDHHARWASVPGRSKETGGPQLEPAVSNWPLFFCVSSLGSDRVRGLVLSALGWLLGSAVLGLMSWSS